MRTRRPAPAHAALAGIVLVVAACTTAGPGASDAASDPPTASTPAASASRPAPSIEPPETVPPSDAPITGEVPGPVLDAVRAELAKLIGGDASAATVVVAEAVEWPDGSLGCPEPGMMYTQAIVPGYRVVLELDGARYDYRVAEQGIIRLCENPGPLGG